MNIIISTGICRLQDDPRLATFDEFLSEHWDIPIVLGYLQANNMAMQAATVPCVDYPVRSTEPNAQPYICLRKASYVADAVLGVRSEKAKERFLQVGFLHDQRIPVKDEVEPVAASYKRRQTRSAT